MDNYQQTYFLGSGDILNVDKPVCVQRQVKSCLNLEND